ncbi:hypothetical protein K7640_02535 [Micromonospora sp. PLK6-60]|uniref:hypothetical protein n=1 Tax=Micromonospora sp. PLK6-60 TaxID=2873383 RepID=UPI001CA7740B|nr:hypothetical protein [Micromonospora sp. PLK6-60]MBY8870718.1 hypothetical protein [Micromonospora sp. PLK6-60]
MIERPEVPFLVQVAWFVLDDHTFKRCAWCHPDGWCPRVALSRAQILAWRRVRDLR